MDEQNNDYYFKLTNRNEIGFKDSQVYTTKGVLEPLNNDIQIGKGTKIIQNTDTQFEIILVLRSKESGQSLELRSIFNILEVKEGEEYEEND